MRIDISIESKESSPWSASELSSEMFALLVVLK